MFKNVGVFKVLGVMWQGVRPWGWMFWAATFCQISAVVIVAQVPIQLKKFFDVLVAGNTGVSSVLVGILVTVFCLQIVRQLFNRLGGYLISRLNARVIPRLMQSAFEYTLGHSSHFFENAFSGALVQKVRRLSTAYRTLIESYYFDLLPVVVQVVAAVTILYFFQPLLSLLVAVWVAVFVTLNYILAVKKVALDIPRAAMDTQVTATLADSFSNMNAIIAYATAGYEALRFRQVSEGYGDALLRSWIVSVIFNGLFSLCIVVLEFAVYYVGIGLWERGQMSIGTFVLVQVYVVQLANNLWGFGELIRKTYESVSESLEVVEILETPHGVTDVGRALPLAVTAGSIQFDGITFAYNETREVIHDVTVEISGGQKVAMIGPSGAGKSTFMRLLMRTYDPTAGAVRIDGADIAQVQQESLRQAIAFVPQDPSLFHRTLMDNIRYGRMSATDAEVIEAAKLAHCDEFIRDLPQGYNTLVGERGVKLSGGERQRVAIARAMLKDAPILVLDEATSSLDSHSEALIQDALDVLMKGKTVIVIAHRLSTIRKMDRILVIDGGTIREDGTHEELLKHKDSLYKSLWELQAGGFLKEEAEA